LFILACRRLITSSIYRCYCNNLLCCFVWHFVLLMSAAFVFFFCCFHIHRSWLILPVRLLESSVGYRCNSCLLSPTTHYDCA
jgi:hypothetical protein